MRASSVSRELLHRGWVGFGVLLGLWVLSAAPLAASNEPPLSSDEAERQAAERIDLESEESVSDASAAPPGTNGVRSDEDDSDEGVDSDEIYSDAGIAPPPGLDMRAGAASAAQDLGQQASESASYVSEGASFGFGDLEDDTLPSALLGYAEVRLISELHGSDQRLEAVEVLRPTLQVGVGPRLQVTATLHLQLSQGESQTDYARDLLSQQLGAPLAEQLLPTPRYANRHLKVNQLGDYLEVDRLFLDWMHPSFDVRIGRQAIRWGSGRFFNPTDPFPEILFAEPWRPQVGINAARASIPLGESGARLVTLAAVDDALEQPSAFVKTQVNLWETDFALTAGYRATQKVSMLGIDVSGELGVGYWIEASLNRVGTSGPVEELLVTGVDYTFEVLDGLGVTLQYYRQGDGESLPERYQRFAPAGESRGVAPFGSGLTPTRLLGRDYAMVAVNLALAPELSVDSLWLQNLNDGSATSVVTIGAALTGAWKVSVSGILAARTWGSDGEFRPARASMSLPLTSSDGAARSVDLSQLPPSSSLNAWVRYSF